MAFKSINSLKHYVNLHLQHYYTYVSSTFTKYLLLSCLYEYSRMIPVIYSQYTAKPVSQPVACSNMPPHIKIWCASNGERGKNASEYGRGNKQNRLLSEYAGATLRQNDRAVNYFSIFPSMLQ